jgi:hypothetical protein
MAEALTKPVDDWTPILVEFHFRHAIVDSLVAVSGIGSISPSSTTMETLQYYLRTMYEDNSFSIRKQVARRDPKEYGTTFQLWVRWGARKEIPDTHLKTTAEIQSAFKLMGNRGWKDRLVAVADTVPKASMGADSKNKGRDLDKKVGGSAREWDEDREPLPPYGK